MSRHVYIIHGWTYSIAPWQQTIDELAKRGVTVTMLKVPGLTSPSTVVWTIDAYVKWLDEQLAGVEQPVVLGHSNGGRIALHYAATHPGRLRHIILLASAGIEVKENRLSLKRRTFRVAAKLFAFLKHVPFAKKIVYRLLKSDYNDAPENMKQTLANMLESDRTFDASQVLTPVTILWGNEDRTTPPSMAEKLHALLPISTLQLVPEWQHAPYRTHPLELAEKIDTALEQIA